MLQRDRRKWIDGMAGGVVWAIVPKFYKRCIAGTVNFHRGTNVISVDNLITKPSL